jgi:hypothetical protein
VADETIRLTPNITLDNVGCIINSLKYNPGIFSLFPTSGDQQSITPARLQSLGTGMWKIERLDKLA